MKEVKEWDDHQREMWVWDDDFSRKRKLLVIYIIEGEKDCTYPVIAFGKDTADVESFKHCAEIEPTRRMTCEEVAVEGNDRITKDEAEELKRLEQLLLIDLRAAHKIKRRLHEMFDGRAMLQGIVYNASRDCVDFVCGAINDLHGGERLVWLHGADALIKFIEGIGNE